MRGKGKRRRLFGVGKEGKRLLRGGKQTGEGLLEEENKGGKEKLGKRIKVIVVRGGKRATGEVTRKKRVGGSAPF